jgi:hypothetical protein
VKAWSAAVGGGQEAPAAQPDGSRYVVRQSGSVAVLLENVPEASIAPLVTAAAGAFR